MKNFYYFIVLFISIIILNSCTPKLSSNIRTFYDPLQTDQEIIVIPREESKPRGVELLGTGSVDTYEYMVDCSYEDIIYQAKEKARSVGGNCIKITWHLAPSKPYNNCHQIKFEILRLNNRQLHAYTNNNSSKETKDLVKERELSPPPTLADNTTPEDNTKSTKLTQNLDIEEKNQKKKTVNREYNKYRLGISGGYSYQPNVIAPINNRDYKAHYKELANGNHITIDAKYFIKKDIGIGLKYNGFNSIASTSNIRWEDMDNKTHIGLMKDYLKVSFYGMSFTIVKKFYAKNEFIASMAFGKFDYYNKGVFIKDYLITANTIGAIYDLSYHRIISENFTLNLQTSVMSGTYKNYKLEIDPLIERSKKNWMRQDKISRFDASIGIVYSW